MKILFSKVAVFLFQLFVPNQLSLSYVPLYKPITLNMRPLVKYV